MVVIGDYSTLLRKDAVSHCPTGLAIIFAGAEAMACARGRDGITSAVNLGTKHLGPPSVSGRSLDFRWKTPTVQVSPK